MRVPSGASTGLGLLARLFVAAGLALAGLLPGAPHALAAAAADTLPRPGGYAAFAPPVHSSVRSVRPADGAVLDSGPSELVLTFDENINPTFVQVSLTRGEIVVPLSAPSVKGPVVRVTLGPPGAGDYRIAFRVVSADGHPVSGESHFRVTGSAAPTSATSTTTTDPAATSTSSTSNSTGGSASSTRPPVTATPSATPVSPGSSPDAAPSATPWLVGGGILLLGAVGAGVAAARRR